MSIYQNELIPQLTTAIVQGYPSADGQGTIKMMLWTLNIDFDARATRDATFELTLNDILLQLNQAARLDEFFALLAQDSRPGVTMEVGRMRAAVAMLEPAGFDNLAKARLIVEGHPFINHDALITTILPGLLDHTSPIRAVFMTGPTDSGKTFSLPLIRRLCREAPQPKKCVPAVIDLMKLATTRDVEGLVRTVVAWLRLNQFVMPRFDTSESRMAQRLVEALAIEREMSDNTRPTLLVFDHLDKDVAPGIIDFAEEVALAAANGTLKDVRVVLIGFPRSPSTNFAPGKLASDIVVQPNPRLVFEYIDRALSVLNRDVDDEDLTNRVNGVFGGQQPPYSRALMTELPEKVRGILRDIMNAPTT
jgi:hypothetical protein